ncbi:hypothetical protein ACVWXO_007076 [Bradyrhizobium sp. LM2.7]
MLEIDGKAALVAPGRQMVDAVARDEMIGDRPVALKRPLYRLDCDDVGAEISERLRRQRPREIMIEAEDFDAVEQAHSFTPNLSSRDWRAGRHARSNVLTRARAVASCAAGNGRRGGRGWPTAKPM